MVATGECATFVHMKQRQWQDLFSMTRQERRGTIVLLVLIALLLGASWTLKNCGHQDSVPIQSIDIEKFESEIDTVAAPDFKPVPTHRRNPTHKKRKPRTPKAPKPTPAPRPVDPVPQF